MISGAWYFLDGRVTRRLSWCPVVGLFGHWVDFVKKCPEICLDTEIPKHYLLQHAGRVFDRLWKYLQSWLAVTGRVPNHPCEQWLTKYSGIIWDQNRYPRLNLQIVSNELLLIKGYIYISLWKPFGKISGDSALNKLLLRITKKIGNSILVVLESPNRT